MNLTAFRIVSPAAPTPPGVPIPYPNIVLQFDEADALFGKRGVIRGRNS